MRKVIGSVAGIVIVSATAALGIPRAAPLDLQSDSKRPPGKTAQAGKVAEFPAPGLPDLSGKKHRLAELKGQSVAVFFFCGCEACYAVTKEWASLQQGGVLPTSGKPTIPRTVVVYTGLESDSIRTIVEASGLDRAGTLILQDQEERASKAWAAKPCPRVFVLDKNHRVRFTNANQKDISSPDTASLIAAQALTALRNVTTTSDSHKSEPKRNNP